MKRDDITAEIEHLRGKIGMWDINLNGFSKAEFQIGYYFDCADNLWKVYMNYDKGMNVIRLKTESEEEALTELLLVVRCRAETHEYAANQKLQQSC